MIEGAPLDQFHRQKRDAVGLLNRKDRDDVRVVQSGQDLRFPLEAGEAIGIVGEGIRQNLDRHVAIEFRISGLVDFAHAAGAEGGEDFVRTEASAGSERQGVRDYKGWTAAQTWLLTVAGAVAFLNPKNFVLFVDLVPS
jgi:hypothetical protein